MGSLSPRRRSTAALFPLLLALLWLAPVSASMAADKRPITESDLFKFVWVGDPQISPDGTRVAFVKVTVNAKKSGYDTALWIVDTDGKSPARAFTSGPFDGSPRWSPDGRWISFVRAEKKGDDVADPQIFLISSFGGEAVQLTDVPKGAAMQVWSPDSRRLAFLANPNEKDLAKQRSEKDEEAAAKPPKPGASEAEKAEDKAKEAKDKKAKDDEHESDVVVVTRARFREDNDGYADFTRPVHIWTIDVPTAEAPKPIAQPRTAGSFDEFGITWSPDGKRLYFHSDRVQEPYYQQGESKLWSIASTGEVVKSAKPGQGMEPVLDFQGGVGELALSPDGKSIAFQATENGPAERSYNESDLELLTLGAKGAVNLTQSLDGDIGEGVSGDQHPPRGGLSTPILWSRDGKRIVALLAERGRSNLQSFGADGAKPQPLTQGDQEVVSYSATPNLDRLAVTIANPTTIGDLYALDPASGALTVLYRPNQELFDGLKMAPLEEFSYPSFDGRKMQAFVQRPPDFDPAKKYPLIVNIHGGPHTAYGYTFFHEMQWMAAKGYVVLYTNPRGSSSFGQEFGNINQYDFPGNDAKDILAGVDAIVQKGFIDPKKMGVTGGSGGGILTNWIVTQTDRFAAAVAQRSISDWTAFWGTTDFTLFTKMWFHGAPWEDPQDFARRSPLTHVTNIKTPLMFIEGESDYRTPPGAGGEPIFRALKYLKRPTAMVRFPGEGHELSRSGRPWHRIERLQHILRWFDKYLKGEKIDTYDIGADE